MTYTTKTIKCDDGEIHIYDDLFTYTERLEFHNFILNSMFSAKGCDIGGQPEYQFYSSYSAGDVGRMGFSSADGYKTLCDLHGIDKLPVRQSRVNAVMRADCNSLHSDYIDGLTLLYYSNLDWRPDWGGHTLFLNKFATDAEYTCLYKPGRVVLFDGKIPHLIFPTTYKAPIHRFSFVIQYSKEKKN